MKCPLCDYEFLLNDRATLVKHLIGRHLPPRTRGQRWRCWCGVSYRLKRRLLQHVAGVSPDALENHVLAGTMTQLAVLDGEQWPVDYGMLTETIEEFKVPFIKLTKDLVAAYTEFMDAAKKAKGK